MPASLLARSDQLMDALEYARIQGQRRVAPALRREVDILAEKVRVPVVSDSYRAVHDALFNIQARLLRLQTVGTDRPKIKYRIPNRYSWPHMPLIAPNTFRAAIGSPEWWEYTEGRLERLRDRWEYAATWARRQPTRKRAVAMEQAWDDYYSGLITLTALRKPASNRAYNWNRSRPA